MAAGLGVAGLVVAGLVVVGTSRNDAAAANTPRAILGLCQGPLISSSAGC